MASSSSAAAAADIESLLQPPTGELTRTVPAERTQTKYDVSPIYTLGDKTYQQQFSDMYYLRLSVLKPIVEAIAAADWSDFVIGDEVAHAVDRVLDVRQGELCWVTGTVYMDMPLKPNILEDISKDHFLLPPPPREKYTDAGLDQTMLEDESGRLRLTGSVLGTMDLVTGVVIAALGTETADGEFQVVDVRTPGLPQHITPAPTERAKGPKKVAIASGLGISGAVHEDLSLHLLCEYLLGESGSTSDHADAATITRLILAGNSLGVAQAPLEELNTEAHKKVRTKKYGYDASAYNPSPTRHFDALLSSLCPSIAVTLLPGSTDPANVSLPQQPLHPALFPTAKVYDGSTLSRVTNPWAGTLDGLNFLGTSGQNLDDALKYVDTPSRLDMCELMLRWRIVAPTAPDTLWSYPFQDRDPFVIADGACPHVFIVGNQPQFETKIVEGDDGQRVRVVLVPKFDVTRQIVLLDLETLEVEVVEFGGEEGDI
ncbi:DNA polymerase delta subunit 2 [Geopyxis carbonaria]|nr:DNA polymerase delta subunit 2 [Geopyxis carbonaria]